MSKLSILCIITSIGSLVNAALGGRRGEDLLEMGFQVQSVCLEVTQLLKNPYLNAEPIGHSGVPVKDLYALVQPVALPDKADQCFPIGSPNLLVTLHDGPRTLKCTFTSVGECVLKDSNSNFVELMSDVVYVPYSNKVVLSAYHNSSCPLLSDFMSLLQSRSSSIVAWRLFGRDNLVLKYDGKPWSPLYATASQVIMDPEKPILNYMPPRGLTANHILNSQINSAEPMRMTGDVSGDFKASFNGYADELAPDDFVVSVLLSRMPMGITSERSDDVYLRNRKTTDALLAMFPEFYSVTDYAGIASHEAYRPVGLTIEELQARKSNEKGYGYVYSVVNEYLRGLPFGTVSKVSHILEKLSAKKSA